MKNANASTHIHHDSSTTASSKKTSKLLALAALLLAATGVLSAQAIKSYSQLKAEHPGWIQAPGQLIRPDCVHRVPSGAEAEIDSDGNLTGDVKMNGTLIAHYDSCPEQAIDTRFLGSQGQQEPRLIVNGWVEASQWEVSLKSPDNIDELAGYMHVPPPPQNSGALVYLFNGIEPAGGNWIIQPVLQWGDNGGFGGDYYVMASWLVGPTGSGIVLVSDPINVNVGDWIVGVTEQNGVTDTTLSYDTNAEDNATNPATSSVLKVTVSTSLHWVWGYAGVLEAYNVTSCSQFPSNNVSDFYQTKIAHGYPAFDFFDPRGFHGVQYSGGTQCKFGVSVSGNSSKTGSTSLLKY